MKTFLIMCGMAGLLLVPLAFALWMMLGWRPVLRAALTPEEALDIRRRRRLAMALMILPAVCFTLSFITRMPLPDWQSGRFADYCLVAINARVSGWFLPLIAYAVLCAVLLLRDPRRHAATWIRIGIVGGLLLTLQFAGIYLALLAPAIRDLIRHPHVRDVSRIMVRAVPLVAAAIMLAWAVASRRRWLLRLSGVAGISLAVGAAIMSFSRTLPALHELLIGGGWMAVIMILLFAPFWCMAIFLYLILVWQRQAPMNGSRRPTFVGASLWSAAYAISLAEAVSRGISLYKSLPTSPPGCFVVTAAANGHRRIVGSVTYQAADGACFPANLQLRYFKALEIALLAACPTTHRAFRRVYNRAGPPIARLIRHPVAADIAYVAMKPAEWLVRCLFRRLLPTSVTTIEKLWADERRKNVLIPATPSGRRIHRAEDI